MVLISIEKFDHNIIVKFGNREEQILIDEIAIKVEYANFMKRKYNGNIL